MWWSPELSIFPVNDILFSIISSQFLSPLWLNKILLSHNFFLHSSVDGHRVLVPFPGMTTAAINMDVPGPLRWANLESLRCTSRSGLLGHRLAVLSGFHGTPVLISMVMTLVLSPWAPCKCSSPHTLTSTGLLSPWWRWDCPLWLGEIRFQCSFNRMETIELFCQVFLDSLCSFFGELPVKFGCPFLDSMMMI